MRSLFKYWLPVLLWAGIIFGISSVKGEDLPSIFPGQDTLFHFVVYLILALLLSRAVRNSRFSALSDPKRFLLVITVCIIYAIFDEYHQQFVIGRYPSLTDLMYDSMGTILGTAIYKW